MGLRLVVIALPAGRGFEEEVRILLWAHQTGFLSLSIETIIRSFWWASLYGASFGSLIKCSINAIKAIFLSLNVVSFRSIGVTEELNL